MPTYLTPLAEVTVHLAEFFAYHRVTDPRRTKMSRTTVTWIRNTVNPTSYTTSKTENGLTSGLECVKSPLGRKPPEGPPEGYRRHINCGEPSDIGDNYDKF